MAVPMIGIALFRARSSSGSSGSSETGRAPAAAACGTALAILDCRFAEGALSLDDYHQRRDILTGDGNAAP
jgi:hypothetical protein